MQEKRDRGGIQVPSVRGVLRQREKTVGPHEQAQAEEGPKHEKGSLPQKEGKNDKKTKVRG